MLVRNKSKDINKDFIKYRDKTNVFYFIKNFLKININLF